MNKVEKRFKSLEFRGGKFWDEFKIANKNEHNMQYTHINSTCIHTKKMWDRDITSPPTMHKI